MIINPTPFVGWNSVYPGPINHFAMATDTWADGSVQRSDLHFRVSSDGRKFYPLQLQGDIAKAVVSGATGALGAFVPSQAIKVGIRYIVVGRMYDAPDRSRCAIFTTMNLRRWTRVVTSIDGAIGSTGVKQFTAIAANASYIVAITQAGEMAVSVDGGASFPGYGNIGLTSTFEQTAFSIAASSAGFVVVGQSDGNPRLFTASDPRSTWTIRTSQFPNNSFPRRAVAGNVFCVTGSKGKISTAPLNDLTTWTARTSGTMESYLDYLMYGDRWFASTTGGNTFLSSSDASSWAAPIYAPTVNPNSGYWRDGRWYLHSGFGNLTVGDGDTSWEDISHNGLAEKQYLVSLAA